MEKEVKGKRGVIIIILAAVLLIGAAVTAILLLIPHDVDVYRLISVSEIVGDVTVENKGEIYKAYPDMHLTDGFAMTTAKESYSRLTLDESKFVKLEELSRAQFKSIGSGGKSTAIILDYGQISNEITRPLAAGEEYTVTTPNAVLTVRGTVFVTKVRIMPDGTVYTDVYTFAGKVATHRILQDGTAVDEEVIVGAQYKTTIVTEPATAGADPTTTTYYYTVIDDGDEGNDNVDPIYPQDIDTDILVEAYAMSVGGLNLCFTSDEIKDELEKRGVDTTNIKSHIPESAIDGMTTTTAAEPPADTTSAVSSDDDVFVTPGPGPGTKPTGEDAPDPNIPTDGNSDDNGDQDPETPPDDDTTTPADTSAPDDSGGSSDSDPTGSDESDPDLVNPEETDPDLVDPEVTTTPDDNEETTTPEDETTTPEETTTVPEETTTVSEETTTTPADTTTPVATTPFVPPVTPPYPGGGGEGGGGSGGGSGGGGGGRDSGSGDVTTTEETTTEETTTLDTEEPTETDPGALGNPIDVGVSCSGSYNQELERLTFTITYTDKFGNTRSKTITESGSYDDYSDNGDGTRTYRIQFKGDDGRWYSCECDISGFASSSDEPGSSSSNPITVSSGFTGVYETGDSIKFTYTYTDPDSGETKSKDIYMGYNTEYTKVSGNRQYTIVFQLDDEKYYQGTVTIPNPSDMVSLEPVSGSMHYTGTVDNAVFYYDFTNITGTGTISIKMDQYSGATGSAGVFTYQNIDFIFRNKIYRCASYTISD